MMAMSFPERVVANFLNKLRIDYIVHDRSKIINPLTNRRLELDFYLPRYNIGIEVQSRYHNFRKQQYRDVIKKRQCREKNINLYTIHAPITKSKLNTLARYLKRF